MVDVLRETFLLLLVSLAGHILDAVGEGIDMAACSGEQVVTSGTVLTSNYSQLLSCGNWSRTVTIADGYNMQLTVNSLHIGPDDFLAISSGSRMVVAQSTVFFVGKIRTARKLRAVRSSTVHIQFATAGTSTFDLEGFTITFSTDRPLTTTPVPTVPPSTLPTAPAKVQDTYTIYLSGRKAVDFLQFKASLQTAVKEMAERFCEDHNITTMENITEQNVVFRYVERCDVTWPNSVQCTKVRLAVPLVVSSGYQLTAYNIKLMWDTYARQSPSLSLLGLQVYTAPDAQVSMLMWLGMILGITLSFSIVMLVIWTLLGRKSRPKRNPSMTESQVRLSSASKQSWLDELPHQELPINAAGGLREFEPDSMHVRTPVSSAPPEGRPHVPVPDSKPLPEYGATLLFGHRFNKQMLMEEEADREVNTSVS